MYHTMDFCKNKTKVREYIKSFLKSFFNLAALLNQKLLFIDLKIYLRNDKRIQVTN